MKIFRNPRDDWLVSFHPELANRSYHFIQKEDMSKAYPLFYYSSFFSRFLFHYQVIFDNRF